ncbi:MAG: hypothetical protein ACLPPF_15170 [Rhodomicrobium sp.]
MRNVGVAAGGTAPAAITRRHHVSSHAVYRHAHKHIEKHARIEKHPPVQPAKLAAEPKKTGKTADPMNHSK